MLGITIPKSLRRSLRGRKQSQGCTEITSYRRMGRLFNRILYENSKLSSFEFRMLKIKNYNNQESTFKPALS